MSEQNEWDGNERRSGWRDPRPDGNWHLDKRIPIAFLTGLLMQTMVFTWWQAQQAAEVNRLRADVTQVQAERREEARAVRQQGETLATLRETALQQQRTLEQIQRQIEAGFRRSGLLP